MKGVKTAKRVAVVLKAAAANKDRKNSTEEQH